MKSPSALVLAAACAVFAPGAAAQNWVGLLKGGPAEFFDEADLRLFMDTWNRTLNDTSDNQVQHWANPDTGHRGEITAIKSFESNGRKCRDLRIYNEAQSRKATNVLHLCNVDGRWRLVGRQQK